MTWFSAAWLTFAGFLGVSTLIAGVGGAGRSLMVVSRYLRSEVLVVQWRGYNDTWTMTNITHFK